MRLKHFSVAFGLPIFKALGDESRVRILHLLWRNQEMCISDLEQVLDFTQTKTSRQLATLKSAGLVSFRRLDNWVFYFIKDEALDFVQQLLSYMERDTQLAKDQKIYQTLWSNRELAAYKLQNRRWTGTAELE
ncbi:helix-turn-helix transcriptional regulator [Hymenobacter lutimineralis]|uniref:Helix-turn-helix transcriptional regulator n=1 Tax=Hymenobacter lutimineralis TaxID=2606448 RepID=A0A5D6V4R0_9BACT|nr:MULTISPECIES: metalloregulator ArsR/SmtB family transcription factor [Hymenobacter]QIX62200.1 helix-turn-helix transcriptional regulator [Hymenobacter sp. BT18]TYZ10082.1 helix-turn-helix transcriptional regulator [Hymenobacter lutimineralis]